MLEAKQGHERLTLPEPQSSNEHNFYHQTSDFSLPNDHDNFTIQVS